MDLDEDTVITPENDFCGKFVYLSVVATVRNCQFSTLGIISILKSIFQQISLTSIQIAVFSK